MSTPAIVPGSSALGSLGPIVIATDVDGAVLNTLTTWFPTYLRLYEQSRQIPVGTLPRPAARDIGDALTDFQFPDHKLPAIIVSTNQTAGRPIRHPDQTYEAAFQVTAACVVRGQTPHGTRRNAATYEGVARQILMQQGRDGPPGWSQTVWQGFTLEPLPYASAGQGRYLVAGISRFEIYYDEVAQSGRYGPMVPDQDVYWPDAGITEVTTQFELSSPTGGST